MANLSDKLKNGVVINKDLVVVCRDFDGNIKTMEKLEYVSNKEYQKFLLEQKELKEKLELEKQLLDKKEKEEKLKLQNEYNKEKVLSAFDRWYRDVINGIVVFEHSMYEEVINWYREYLNNNNIEVHKELDRYL